jgi:Tfp pilus assembly protein PilV
MKIKNSGQSLIEMVFSIGVLVTVIVGVVSLMVKTTAVKTTTNTRKKASEMTGVIIEKLLEDKTNDPDKFWQLNNVSPSQLPGYEGYRYTVVFDVVTGNNCSSTVVECADATVEVVWGNNEKLTVKRFFSRRI